MNFYIIRILFNSIAFVFLATLIYFYTIFIYQVSEFYQIKSINMVDTFDDFQTSVSNAVRNMRSIDTYDLSPLPGIILYICTVISSRKLFIPAFLALTYAHDGIFYTKSSDFYSSLNIGIFIISIWSAFQAIKCHETNNNYYFLVVYLLISNFSAMILIEERITTLLVSISVTITCLFKIPSYFIIKNKITQFSQSFLIIFSLSVAFIACDILISSLESYKIYNIKIDDLYQLIYSPTEQSKHIRCKISNNSITALMFIYSIFDRKNNLWPFAFYILIPGFISLIMKSTLSEFRVSMNECRNTNYYDLRLLIYLIISLVISNTKNIYYSSIFMIALVISSYFWRFDSIPFYNIKFL